MILDRIKSALPFLMLLFLANCAAVSPEVMYKMQDDLREVKKEVASLKTGVAMEPKTGGVSEVVEETAPVSPDMKVRREIASIKADMDALRGEIHSFQAFVDETKYMMKQESLATTEKISNNEKRLMELEADKNRVRSIEEELVRLEKELAALKGIPPSQIRTPAPTPGPDRVFTSQSGDATPRVPRLALNTPEDLYDYALGLIKAGKFRDARKSLEEFSNRYPKNRLMPNVFYWRGETFYAEKDFEAAAISLQEVLDKYPDSPKAPDALYKQGLCFINLKDPASATAAFRLLVAKYPTSAPASKAEKKLKDLEKQGGR